MKRRQLPLVLVLISLGFFLLSATAPASAALMTYTSRTAWVAAVNALGETTVTQTFGSMGDTNIPTGGLGESPITVGDFSLLELGSVDRASDDYNIIDAPPAVSALPNQSTGFSGSYLRGLVTKTGGATRLQMQFSSDIFAWGAGFNNPTDGAGLALELANDSSTTGLPTIELLDTVTADYDGFFGFVFNDKKPFDRIRFEFTGYDTAVSVGEGFGMDDVSYNSGTPVPIPATIWLLGAPLLCLFRVRKKARK
jgi:hypothetical protein